MPRTKRIDREVKKRFVQALHENGNNRTEAYLQTIPTAHARTYAAKAGCKLFKDPEVQEIFQTEGIDLTYLAKKNKDLLENSKDAIKVQLVKQLNQAVLKQSPTESKRLNINLFGDLTDAQVERIRQGRKAIETDGGVSADKPE